MPPLETAAAVTSAASDAAAGAGSAGAARVSDSWPLERNSDNTSSSFASSCNESHCGGAGLVLTREHTLCEWWGSRREPRASSSSCLSKYLEEGRGVRCNGQTRQRQVRGAAAMGRGGLLCLVGDAFVHVVF